MTLALSVKKVNITSKAHLRDDVVKLVVLHDMCRLLRDIARIDGKHALRARLRGEQRQDASAASHVHHNSVTEDIGVGENELRVGRGANLVRNHDGVDVCIRE